MAQKLVKVFTILIIYPGRHQAYLVYEMDFPKQSPLKQIRKFCLDCAGGSPKEVRYCTCTECALWPFRFGRRPNSVIRAEGPKSAEFFDKRNFEERGRFDPTKGIGELE
jgi:hypothetical protein